MSEALTKLIFDLENSPPDKDAVFITYWDSNDPPIDHFRKHYLTCGELLTALKGGYVEPVRNVAATVAVLNIRGGAGTNFPIVGTLTLNTVVEIYDAPAVNSFYQLTPAEPPRWVSAMYVRDA